MVWATFWATFLIITSIFINLIGNLKFEKTATFNIFKISKKITLVLIFLLVFAIYEKVFVNFWIAKMELFLGRVNFLISWKKSLLFPEIKDFLGFNYKSIYEKSYECMFEAQIALTVMIQNPLGKYLGNTFYYVF